MSKIKLLQVLLVSGILGVVGCSSAQVDDDSGASTSTETTAPAETGGVEADAGSSTGDVMVIDTPEQAGTGGVMIIDTPVAEEEPAMAMPQITVVFFAFDSFTVDAASRDVLDQHATYLRDNPDSVVVLEGHTDERGSAEYNLALGENRAKAVQDYLSLRGVDGAQMYVTSFGEMKPAARGSNESAWALNRRVQIQYQ
ncbi:peptidoglycan-associated lipoprotein Pal [Salinispirillum marinum]|uniref:Peptidoglycan-associated lipoprotein n=2 Tax=Saccharospirillaceae TaxID=255527 RepID=A0ABV8B922_9GAMM